MSQTGFNATPPPVSAAQARRAEQAARVITVAVSEQTPVPPNKPVEARVQAVRSDGMVRVQTPQGEITFKVEDPAVLRELEAYVRQEKARIAIKVIPQNAPSRGPAPDQPAQPTTVQTAQVSLPPMPPRTPLPADIRHSATDVNVAITTDESALVQPQNLDQPLHITLKPNAPLPPQAFRLEPISESLVQQHITTNPAPIITATLQPQTPPVVAPIVTSTATDTPLFQTQTQTQTPSPSLTITTRVDETILQLPTQSLAPKTVPILTTLPDITPALTLPTAPDAQTLIQITPALDASLASKTIIPAPQIITGVETAAPIINAPAQTIASTPTVPPIEITNPILKAGYVPATIVAKTPEGLPMIAINAQTQAFAAPVPLSAPVPNAAITNASLTSSEFFILHAPLETVPIGATLTLSPQSVGSAEPLTQPLGPIAALAAPLGFFTPAPWEAMNTTLQTLAQTAPPVAQAFSAMIPAPAAAPANVAPAALFFIAAIRGGDVQSWLGEKAVQALRNAGRGNTITQLGNDMASIARAAAEPNSDGWRMMALPMMWHNEIHKMRVAYKRDDSQSDETLAQGGKPLRFVIDIDLNALGDVQLDALFKPDRLDMIVRSAQTFSPAMHQSMRRLYTDAIKHAGIGGELLFQTKDQGWVTIDANEINPKTVDV